MTVEKRAALRPEHLIVETGYYWNRPGGVRREGAVLKAQSAREGGRVFEVRTTAAEVDDPFVTVGTPYLSMALEGRFAVYTGPRKTLDQVAAIVEAHRDAHSKRLADYGAAKEVFTAMQTILGWNLTYDPENDRAIAPVSRLWSAGWGGYVLFDWDTYFASFMYGLYNRDLAFANAVEVTKGVTRRGFIPNCASAYNIQSDDRSQPPVGSLIVLELYKRHKERWFLAEVYDELLRWNRWWPSRARRERAAGLGLGRRAATGERHVSQFPGGVVRVGPGQLADVRWRALQSAHQPPGDGRRRVERALRGRLQGAGGDRHGPRQARRRARTPARGSQYAAAAQHPVGREDRHVPQPAYRYRREFAAAFADQLLSADRRRWPRQSRPRAWCASITSTHGSFTANG